MITRTFKLCLYAGTGSAPYINVSQYDEGETWLFELYSETGERYIPSTGAIVGVKSDGHGIVNTGTVDSDGRVVITETQQMTAAAGRAIFELSIDGLTHGTANFVVAVERKPTDDADLSDSDLSLLQEAIDSVAEIEDLLGGQDVPTVITPIISDWLDENITNPSNPPIDTSLTVAGAAADAKKTGDEISDLKSAFDEISTVETASETETEYYTTPWTGGGGINANGVFVAADSWAYTDKIPVVQGDVITCDASENGNRVSRPIRMLCAYNNDSPVSTAGSSTEISSYTVPNGVTHVVITQASVTYYTGQRVVINRTTTSTVIWLKQSKIGGFRQTGNLNDGEQFVFPITNVKQYKAFTFSGNITTFSSVKMGRSVNGTDQESISVDATNLVITNTYGSVTTIPHGLTIVNDIQIHLATAERNRLSLLRITSNGESFEYTANLHNITWNADIGNPFVRAVGSILVDCSASWTSRRVNSPMWLFGDSYMSYDTARWVYYLIQDGYDEQCLLNAYAGENSQNALIAFNSLISNGRPKYVVWALGMNDGDATSDNAPNGNWLNALNSVIAVCEGRDIELILCTIPTTPVINNNYKNAWIRNSGYRYIDFANAVGADSSGNWFSGMLSSDNVHPTAQGAKALYGRVLTDFPEIVVSN